MNSKDIEAYIKANKKEFDVKMPSDDLWGRIDVELDKAAKEKTLKWPFWLGMAASLLLVLGVMMVMQRKTGHQPEPGDFSSVYARKELRFASLIEEKKDSLQIYASKNPKLYARFNADLNALGDDYEALKRELPQSPNQRVVVRAMVKNLELQLQVISQQLSIINEVNQYKEENQL